MQAGHDERIHSQLHARNKEPGTWPGRIEAARLLSDAGQVDAAMRLLLAAGAAGLAERLIDANAVPRPRLHLHLIRYHGVLAPNAKLRARVVPQGPAARGPAAGEAAAGAAGEIRGDAQPL